MDWSEVVLLLLMPSITLGSGILIMRDVREMPAQPRNEIRRLVIVSDAFLCIAWCGLIVSINSAVNTAPSQQTVYIGMFIAGCAWICGYFPYRRALAIRNAFKSTHRPNIRPNVPPVPDDLAAQRAITHRPYQRGLRRSRWR